MFTDFISKISDSSAAAKILLYNQQRAITVAYILSQPEIRMAVYNSSGLGHQACTANIIRTIARWGYTGKITLYANNDNLDFGSSLYNKIKLLFPQFQQARVTFMVGNVTVEARKLFDVAPTEGIMGILGGYDDDQDFAYKLNVKNLVILQPFRWMRGTNAIIRDTAVTPNFNLNTLDGLYIQNRGFYMPVPSLSQEDKDVLNNSGYGPILSIIESIVASINTPGFNVAAAYGITTVMPGTPEIGLFNYVSGILEAQSQGVKNAKKGAIVLSMGVWGSAMLEPSYWDKFLEWVYAGKLSSGNNAPSAAFSEWYEKEQVSQRVKVLSDRSTLTKEAVDTAISELKTREVLVINIGSLPQILFNYVYAQATLPTVLEGQSTTDMLLNIGSPYFKLSGTDDRQVMAAYPTMPISGTLPGSYGKQLVNLTSNAIRITPDNWANIRGSEVNYPPAAGVILIKSFKDPGTGRSYDGYFKGLKLFFNDEINDKLLLSLNYFVNVLGPIPAGQMLLDNRVQKEELTVAVDPVEALFNQLQGAQTGGVLNYFVAINTGVLYSFFKGLTDNLNIAVLKLEMNGDKTSIELKGTTTDFGIGNSVLDFVFTYENNNYQAQFSASFPDASLALGDAQWLTFSDLGLRSTIKNGDTIPVTGGITFSVDAGKKLDLEIEFPNGDGNLLIAGSFADGALTLADIFQFAGGLNLSSALPAPISAAANIGLSGLEFAYNLKENLSDYFSLQLVYNPTTTWPLIPGLIEITGLGCNIIVYSPGNLATRQMGYTLTGKCKIADGEIAITANLPGLSVYGGLTEDSPPISLDQLITYFLNIPSPVKADIDAFAFSYQGDPFAYSISCDVKTDWPIPSAAAPVFTIEGLGFQVEGTNDTKSGSFSGSITILPKDPNVDMLLLLSASYNSASAGWIFSGKQISGELSISGLIKEYLGWDITMDIVIDGLGITIDTATNYWEFTAKTAKEINIDFLDLSLEFQALIGNGKKDPTAVAGKYGTIKTEVAWLGIDFEVFYDFDPSYASFGIKWQMLEGKVEEKMVKGVKHQVATLAFTDSTTVGSLVETFVSWATGSKFGLASPWDILNDIPLNNLSLVYDFTAKTVSFDIGIGPIELGFATIKGINVSYNTNDPDPDNNGVMVTLDITSLFGDVPSWNAAKPETTPAPPGQGNKYFDLRLLAMGQHVSIPCFKTANTVQDAIACMEKLPEPKQGEIPIAYDPDSSWLIGMDFGVLKLGDDSSTNALALPADNTNDYFLTMQIIFNDPNLYALRIALEGEPAKIFKGLDFQIMYKKVSDTVGVYMAEIVLPDALRQIKMGEFNITLPVFAIQVYTNGDFQVDIGFPWNQDFSRSLSFQAWIITPVGPIPVMGSVGFYFGKLSSATTNKVPVTTTGTFNPVLVFGFGIQFGIGFSFDAGILKAGFSLTAIAILEGVIAKWNPYQAAIGPANDSQVETSYYFWFRGTVGIIGKLYGSIDFAIIKADLNIDIRIIAQMTFASYEPIQLSLTASVDVSLTVTINLGIFKIHISFSFSARISESVTINALGGTAPWADGSQRITNIRVRRMVPSLASQRMLTAAALNPVWSNLIKADTPAPLKGYLGLGLTMAGDNAVQLTDQQACYVTMLFIESVAAPQDDKTGSVLRAFNSVNPGDTDVSFEKLCKMIFRWAIASTQTAPISSDDVDKLIVTDEQLKELMDYLARNPLAISSVAIDNFMSQQFTFTVDPKQTEGEDNATYFPVPDQMGFSVPAYGNSPALAYNYGGYNNLSADYIGWLADYFDQLAVLQKKQADHSEKLTAGNATTSMSSFVFCDYFMLICRQMLQAGRDSLKDFKYFLNPGDSANMIVSWVQQNGQPDYAVQELFSDNATVVLNAADAHQLTITSSSYLVQGGDSFDIISKLSMYAGGFNAIDLATLNQDTQNILQAGISIQYPLLDPHVSLPGQSLTDIAKVFNVPVADLIKNSNITTVANLLLPVATLAVPLFKYTVSGGDTLKSVTSKFGITTMELASVAANGDIPNLFDKSISSIDIVALGQFKAGELLIEIQATQGLQHLSGMTSRYYMAGLRLPTKGITPNYPGMWVTESENELVLPDDAGLYALTGQQFPLPVLGTTAYPITFNTGASWMIFTGSTPATVTVSIVPGQFNALQIKGVMSYATQNRLDVGTTFLGIKGTFNSDFTTYPFTSEISWNCASAISMPYGDIVPGVPSMKLWQLPDTLLQLPDPARKTGLKVKMLLGEYNSASGSMINSEIQYYSYATHLEFSIKKIPAVGSSPSTKTTYEISGADGSNADILEKMAAGIGDNESLIDNLMIAFSVNPNGSTPQGIQSDAPQFLTMGIAKVNLSSDTRPDQALFDALDEEAWEQEPRLRMLNTKTEFIKLLWEASITRAGGFYLYYYNSENAEGLPDSIFNDKNEATIHLVVLYTAPGDPTLCNTVTNYMNALVTAEAIDTTSAVLFAQADPNAVNITPADAGTLTLATLAYGYFENVSDVAADNQTVPLRSGKTLHISEGVYEVGPAGSLPGGDINSIATYFGTTASAIIAANTQRQDWTNPLPLFTSIFLPEIDVIIGTSNGGNTLASLSAYYGQNLSSLANFNQDVAGIFADGNSILISGGPTSRVSAVPAGTVAMEAIRPVPKDIPKDPTDIDFGKFFLQHTYSLLGYQLVENAFFTKSNVGLPTGPTSTPVNSINNDKIRSPKTLLVGDDWTYKQSIPYSRFSKQVVNAIAGLPDPANSPYKGVGDLLQVNFAWQDYYGNRLITTLSDPSAGDGGRILNQPPTLTGYTDALLGAGQWPSISSSWLVNTDLTSQLPMVRLQLNFDNSSYQGLYMITAQSSTVIIASFTMPLDPVSATPAANYLIQQQAAPNSHSLRTLVISSVVLNQDQTSVTITVDRIDQSQDQKITMNIGNISNVAKTLSFSGAATFFYSPAAPVASTTPVTDTAIRDLSVYQQLWYQLTDPNGIEISIETSLLQNVTVLPATQVTDLVQNWLASIYLFIANRAAAGLSVAIPVNLYPLTVPVDFSKVNPAQIFKLNLSLSIERTGGAIAGDFETTGGIKKASTGVPLHTSLQAGSSTYSFGEFAQQFEQAMKVPGQYAFYIASGVDRTENNNSTGGKEIWAVRKGLNKVIGIDYQIDQTFKPAVFAPRPISNELQTRPGVPIYDFNTTTGIDFTTPSRYIDFSQIDMDTWGRLFFNAIDHLLSPEFSAAIQLVDQKLSTPHYANLISNKAALADIIKNWMISAFKDVQADAGVVQESFKQLLLVQLSNAYNANAAIQFEAAVEAAVPAGYAPRLYGNITMNFHFLGVVLNSDDNTELNLFFNSELNTKTAEDKTNYTVPQGLNILSATLRPDNARNVTLMLDGKAAAGVTTVAINPAFTDNSGNLILPPLSQVVQTTIETGNYTNSISITSAKLDLKPATNLPLAFLISSPQVVKDVDDSVVPYIDLDLSYSGTSIEHQIEQLFSGNPYLASSWLSFLTSTGNKSFGSPLGSFKVPMILRNFPSAPSMLLQSGEASETQTGSIDFNTLLNWDYSIHYSEPFHFPQDRLSFTINFNVKDSDNHAFFGIEDAFAQLAEFVTVFPAVNQVFTGTLSSIDATTTDPQKFQSSSVALNAFNAMVNNIILASKGTHMAIKARPSLRISNMAVPYLFDLVESKANIQGVEALIISISDTVPEGIGSPEVQLDDCSSFPYTDNCSGAYCFYFKDKGGNIVSVTDGQKKPNRTIVLPGMNILARQDAETLVELKRNVELVPGIKTADPFVYTTGKVGFPNNFHPTISNDMAIDISTIDAPTGHNVVSLKQQLTNLFNALLKKNTQPVLFFQVNCTYHFSLNDAITGITLPVMMQPIIGVQLTQGDLEADTTLGDLIDNWSGAISLWYGNYKPNTGSGFFNFDLNLFSNLTEQPLPLVRLSSLTLALIYIDDLPS